MLHTRTNRMPWTSALHTCDAFDYCHLLRPWLHAHQASKSIRSHVCIHRVCKIISTRVVTQKQIPRLVSPLAGMTVGVGAKVGSESRSGSGFALADERQCLFHCLDLFRSGPILVLGSGWELCVFQR